MNGNSSAVLDEAASIGQAEPGKAFLKVFSAGVLGWLAGIVILFSLGWPMARAENASIAIIWSLAYWWQAFLFGLVVLCVYGRVVRLPVLRAAVAYVVPVALLACAALVCLAVYPESSFRGDLTTYLPVVVVFYAFGSLWMLLRGASIGAPQPVLAVFPPLVGGLVLLGGVAIPVFAGDAFRYRDAFQLTISQSKAGEGTIQCDGVLKISKPGHYKFDSPRYLLSEFYGHEGVMPEIDAGTIRWGSAGEPGNGATGEFPLQVVWRSATVPEAVKEMPANENSVCIEVRDPDRDNRIIYSLTAPLSAR